MKNRKLQRIIAFASSAAIILSTNGVQYMAQEIGSAVHAEEVILEEDCSDTDTGSVTDGVEAQEVDVWSSYEEPEITVEGIEVSSSAEAEQATGTSLSVDEASETDEDMLVDVRLTEEAQAKAEDGYAQGEVQWMHVYAADRSSADSGEAAVRIYLTDLSDETPAEEVDVFLFDEWKETLPGTVVLPPVVLEDALNGNEDLRITRVQEYKKDENDEYVKDSEGNRIMTADYLEFTLPAGDYAEFSAAMMYRTDAEEYSYSASAYADVMQVTEDGTERVLYDEYSDKKNDNELTVTWEPQEEETEAVTENGTEETTETVTETVTEAVTEAAAEEVTEAATEVSAEDAVAEAMTEESTETVSEAVDAESTEDTTEAITEAAAEGETELSGEVESETELSSEAESETELSSEAESETELSSEAESETELSSEAEGETELSSEAEGETELSSEAESETELSSEAESETELSSEAESETELSSEIESESELSSEVESESETEIESESESGTESAETEAPISSIRVIMTKELEETEAPQADAEAAILSEEGSEAEAQETAAETAEADSESEAAADDTAVSGQTFIVHVQAEDLQSDAQYDSTVSIHLTDLATGLPASDVATAVCQMKEDVLATESAAVNTLYGAVHTPDGTENLVVSRVQETVTAEDGTVTVTDDYLKFDLPAGSSADFYIGFTYATEADAYEKQLMVEVRAVQYIPVQETEAETGAGPEETEISGDTAEQTEEAVQTEAVTEPTLPTTDTNIIDNLSSMAEDEITEELTDAAVTPTADQELLSAASLEENEELSVKTQSADADNSVLAGLGSTGAETEAGADTDGSTVNALTVESTETEGTDTELVEVNVLSSESTLMSMTWAASSATVSFKQGDYIFLDLSKFTNWEDASAVFGFYYNNGKIKMEKHGDHIYRVSIPENMDLSNLTSTIKFFRYSPSDSNINNAEWWNNSPETNLKEAANANSNTYKITSWGSGKISTGEWKPGVINTVSYGGEKLYFINMSTTTSLSDLKAVFSLSADSIVSKEVTMTKVSGLSGYYQVTIPDDEEYDTVTFRSGDADLINVQIIGGDYAPDTTNTFYYAATEFANGELKHTWGTYPGEKSIAGKKLFFDSAVFPANEAGTLQIGDSASVTVSTDAENNPSTLSGVIPEDSGATQQTILTYTTTGGDKYHFLWSDLLKNMVTVSDDIAAVTESFVRAVTVYYDASMSKLSYKGTNDAKSEGKGIPWDDNSGVYYYATGSGKDDWSGPMTKITNGSWTDVYSVNLPAGYTSIRFAGYELTETNHKNAAANGDATDTLEIPMGLNDPCYYGDNSDSVIYDGGDRGGYWDEVYSIRDAESGKGTDVVDIASSTFVRDANTLYVNSTFYDYYSDYELNGNNRDSYGGENASNHRYWVPFRQFDQALSDYYKADGNWLIQIYTGHFQPDVDKWESTFKEIASTLNLYGYNSGKSFGGNGYFFSVNNSVIDSTGSYNSENYAKAAQGLVSEYLSASGTPVTNGGFAEEPHFNEAFLTGENSKNAVLADIYHNVAFPFTQKDRDGNGVMYWTFNSAETTLAMRQDSSTGEYYLKDVGNQGWSQNVNATGTTSGDKVSNTYGFFPFNETASATSGKNYNYGFGTKLEFTFRLTSDGTVLNKNGEPADITFNFSGDDDVWVFIDGQLALDVGGAHGRVDGVLNFNKKKMTATVSKTKTSQGSQASSGQEVQSTFSLENWADEHTLTMFYMERGMWESNMSVSFNFPDENQLEVEKQVDKTEVNSLFSHLFDDASLFTFNIKNLATHYGTYVSDATVDLAPKTFTVTGRTSGSDGNTCEAATQDGISGTHWYAKLTDTSSKYRYKRYGTMTTDSPVDISNMNYLEFKFYYDYNDIPSLSYMYLQLVDTSGNVKGNMATDGVASTDTLSGKTYGTVTMDKYKWVTVRIDLSKLSEEDGFKAKEVESIRFGYNYDRNIYLADWTFYPMAVPQELVGFVTEQYNISDYGSATSGKLEIPTGAMYTSSNNKNYVIGKDGTFVLADQETIIFRDQFRQGSYIYLEEQSGGDLFSTSWTMYENGQAVTSMVSDGTVTNGSITSLNKVSGTTVDDERTETVQNETVNGHKQKNAYVGEQPSEPTFVFRSYADPDTSLASTKLKVVFYNKINTGSLTIKKVKAEDSVDLEDEYVFTVTFTNVGGIGLESEPIKYDKEISLKAGEEYTISGIPLGTYFTISEAKATDGSSLESAVVSPNTSGIYMEEEDVVKGYVTSEASLVTATFTNTKKPLIDINLEKLWKNKNGNTLTENLPDSITVQLQRRQAGSKDEYSVVEGYDSVTVSPGYEGWVHEFAGLDQYVDYQASTRVAWEYRVVELDSDGNAVEDGKMSGDYKVTYSSAAAEDESGAGTEDIDYTITNTYIPKLNLKVIKVDSSDSSKKLQGVTFELILLDSSDNETSTKRSGTTDTDGTVLFEELEEGTYHLKETVTLSGYTLLDKTITVKLTPGADTQCTIDGTIYKAVDNTILYTVSNVPKTKIQITKVKASDSNVKLNGVVFTLDKVVAASDTDTDVITVDGKKYKKDSSFTQMSETTDGTDGSSNPLGIAVFDGLETGTYLLTETRAASGYSLLKSPVLIEIDRTSTTSQCKVDGGNVTVTDNTISITIKNQAKFEIPATGSWSNYIIIFSGMMIAGAALIMYLLQKRRKEGRAS